MRGRKRHPVVVPFLLVIALATPPWAWSQDTEEDRNPTEAPVEAIVRFTEGYVLEPPLRGEEDVDYLLHPERENESWSELFKPFHTWLVEMTAGENRHMRFAVTEPSVVFLKVQSSTSSLRDLSATLLQEGATRPAWSREGLAERERISEALKGRVEVDEIKIERGESWTLSLSNGSSQPISAEVWVGIVVVPLSGPEK